MLSKGVGFEVNTSSLRKGMQQPMPEERIIRALKDRGIEVAIVGSDAHTPRDVGKGIDKALDLLRSSGFSGPSIFRKRKPIVTQWSNLVREKQN
jgi:histidinol-phosphatase (PHP family)